MKRMVSRMMRSVNHSSKMGENLMHSELAEV
jgi:hypothetical protein